MSDPVFAQPERRSFLLPIVVALAALALAVGIAIHFFPATTVNIAHVHTDLLPTHTVFKADSIVLARQQTQDVLFVATTIKLDNQLRMPIYLDDFTLTLTDPTGAELESKAATKDELANYEVSFPALKPLVSNILRRETAIEAGKQAEGTLVFSFPIPQKIWDDRKTGIVKVDLYHQPSLYQTIPKP